MNFWVRFNFGFAPVDLDQFRHIDTRPEAGVVQVLGGASQVALVVPNDSGPLRPEPAQCVSLSGKLWLVGRIRLDAREELCSNLIEPGVDFARESDASICLHAYAHWGDRCVERLKGDFCFVVWDERTQHLFCARDQMGVRPFFFAITGNSLFLSDSIDYITAQKNVSSKLDNYWIGDFLASGTCIDADRTVYEQIKRLPPGHCLSASENGWSSRRYWNLDVEYPIYYKDPRQYIDHFDEVLGHAIRDRLPPGRVGICMSGGLDSSTLAACTVKVTGDPAKVVAHTHYFEHLIPDEEAKFGVLVAGKLGISQTLRSLDDFCYDPHWYTREINTSEPCDTIFQATPQRTMDAEMAELAQVWFLGEGPDNALLFEWRSYLGWLFQQGAWNRLRDAMVQYVVSKEAREWWTTLQTYTTGPCAKGAAKTGLPEWLNDSFARETDLVGRADESKKGRRHSWHPRAFANLTSSIWPSFLEQYDSTPLIWRHPYLDLRVLTFMLSVPPIPWARRKRLIRESMRGILPDSVLARDKTPLAEYPLAILLRKYGLPPLSSNSIVRYVDPTKLPCTFPAEPMTHPLINVYVLDHWLNHRANAAPH